MGEKDLSEKLLEDYNDVFSDIINVFIFQGKQSIKPEELFNSGVFSQYRADDGNSYRTQLLKKTNTIVPVITIALYFGTEGHWNTKKNICSLMDIPHGLEEYVNDYKIHVFEIA